MKRTIVYPIFITILLSCSSLFRFTPIHKKTDRKFDSYIKKLPFKTNTKIGFYKAQGFWDKVIQERTESLIIGFCGLSILPPTNQVSINPDYWNWASYKEKMALLIHEFMHCDYAERHDNNLKKDGCPESIMHKLKVPSACLDKHWKSYMEDIKERL